MKLLIILTSFLSGFIFYSKEVRAGYPQTIKEVKARERSVMDSLNKVFRMEPDRVRKQDEALRSALTDMKNCFYTDNFAWRLRDLFYSNCEELILETRGEKNVSYFLLRKAIEEEAFEAQRREALMGFLEETKDIAIECECRSNIIDDTVWFTLKHKYNTTEEERDQKALASCQQVRGFIHIQFQMICRRTLKNVEHEEEEALSFVQTQAGLCDDNVGEVETAGGNFSCQTLFESGKKEGLSYFQIRYIIQKAVEEWKFAIRVAEALKR